jgi:quinol monooxygenase YgiN
MRKRAQTHCHANCCGEGTMSDEVFWLYEVDVRPGQERALSELMAELIEHARSEPGALAYQWSLGDDSRTAHIYERYADTAATLAHIAAFRETFAQRFLAAVKPSRVIVYGTPSQAVKDALQAMHPVYMTAIAGFTR